AYPDRVAQRRSEGSRRYKLALGRGVQLAEHDPLAAHEWLAVAHADSGQQGEGRVYLAAPLRAEDLQSYVVERDVVGWDARQGALVAQREQRVGELTLATRPLPQPALAQRIAVLCDVIRREGLDVLGWTQAARQWQARVQSLHLWRGDPWPDVSDPALLANVEAWAGPWLDDVTKRADFARLDALTMFQRWMPGPLRAQLDVLAPERLAVPSGSHIRLRYAMDGSPPVLAVRIQEMFGLEDTPTVNGGRVKVLVHLLSPAQCPIQVTQDLRSFWRNTYPVIRKELRGRYPKHAWPEDPLNAMPTRKAKPSAR
ncbi:MAG: ATP-dependent helicase C-terminal domain-containing protein, partial [Candidatus Roseilinea sp.]|uniref:ATP-dependent helicase C-terminal domain-containing protein n=1 Tax=Candidatus Roseilinea sp. TaxID=2838777 RepID=UPI00404B5833